ncbi:MAG: hypothetical protein J2P48_14545 [Alphaproteobacteria bacterium]|nr:hypothetical protein [Alphaproteobacteria bacterium]
MSAIIDNYRNVQQDVLETFIDRGQLRKLAHPAARQTDKQDENRIASRLSRYTEPSVLRNGRRIPGLKSNSTTPGNSP